MSWNWILFGYFGAAWITALYGVRVLGEKGQREIDRHPTVRVLHCTDPNCPGVQYSLIDGHRKNCYHDEPKHPIYERQLSDVVAAIAVGMVWPIALFIASFNLAPKSRAERNAMMRVEHARLERQIAEVQKRYDELIEGQP